MTTWPPFRIKDELSPKQKLYFARNRITFVQQILWMLSRAQREAMAEKAEGKSQEAKINLSFDVLAEILAESIYVLTEVENQWKIMEFLLQEQLKAESRDEENPDVGDEDNLPADEEPPPRETIH